MRKENNMSIVDKLLERREVHDLIRDFSKELLECRKDRKELLSKLDDITFYHKKQQIICEYFHK